MFAVAGLVLGLSVLAWAYQSTKPPQPKICGSPDGPPVTSPRIKLTDGRYLAYKEMGVAKEIAKYKAILIHGYNSSKDLYLPLSQEVFDELSLYLVTFDRAGYGDSDPHPKRSVKSEVFDLQELADQLQLGPKFYLFGASIGSYPVWGSLKYIPHRLAGVGLIVPVTNYWWPSFPSKLCEEVFQKKEKDKWRLRFAHYAPGLLYWWMTQKWIPSFSDPDVFNKRDKETIEKMSQIPMPEEHKVAQQGVHESLNRDLIVGFGNWGFDPMELKNPFPQNDVPVQLWQGYEDRLVPFELQRYVAQKLPWIRYYEVPDGGHLIIHEKGLCEAMFRALLLGEEPSLSHN